jgi:hypothetical protein
MHVTFQSSHAAGCRQNPLMPLDLGDNGNLAGDECERVKMTRLGSFSRSWWPR